MSFIIKVRFEDNIFYMKDSLGELVKLDENYLFRLSSDNVLEIYTESDTAPEHLLIVDNEFNKAGIYWFYNKPIEVSDLTEFNINYVYYSFIPFLETPETYFKMFNLPEETTKLNEAVDAIQVNDVILLRPSPLQGFQIYQVLDCDTTKEYIVLTEINSMAGEFIVHRRNVFGVVGGFILNLEASLSAIEISSLNDFQIDINTLKELSRLSDNPDELYKLSVFILKYLQKSHPEYVSMFMNEFIVFK